MCYLQTGFLAATFFRRVFCFINYAYSNTKYNLYLPDNLNKNTNGKWANIIQCCSTNTLTLSFYFLSSCSALLFLSPFSFIFFSFSLFLREFYFYKTYKHGLSSRVSTPSSSSSFFIGIPFNTFLLDLPVTVRAWHFRLLVRSTDLRTEWNEAK